MPSGVLGALNRLLPFATPGTPLLQDLIHLAAVCLVLYYAPQIQEILQRQRHDAGPAHQRIDGDAAEPEDEAAGHEILENQPDDQDVLDDIQADAAPAHHEPADAVQEVENEVPEGQPGPARAPNTAANRNIGAKKAKSLARRDQRRAYHEFMRSQGDAQRARDAEGAAEREAALNAEKERRRAATAALDIQKAKERDERKAKEERDRRDEIKRRELAVSIVRDELNARNMCDPFRVAEQVGGDVDDEWVERLLNTAGVLGKKGDTMTMVTSMGWVVRVTEQQMTNLYISAAQNGIGSGDGRIDIEDLGAMLEAILRA